jgi:hypothetical protein
MAAPTRMALLEALVDSVKERDEKRRRVQISFAIEDIKRKLRRTHPDLSARTIKDMLLALLNAGLLMHKDGTAVRSPNASFTLTKTADQLNRKLTELYLRELKKAGADLTNVRMLAELFFGDPDRRRDVETALAWAAAPNDESANEDAPRGRNRPAETAVDDLFLVEDDAPAAAPAPRGDDDGGRRRGGGGACAHLPGGAGGLGGRRQPHRRQNAHGWQQDAEPKVPHGQGHSGLGEEIQRLRA